MALFGEHADRLYLYVSSRGAGPNQSRRQARCRNARQGAAPRLSVICLRLSRLARARWPGPPAPFVRLRERAANRRDSSPSSSAGVWSAWTEMPGCPPEQERRSRPGLVVLGRTRRPSRKRIALRGCRAVRPPIVRSRRSLSRGRRLSDGVPLQVAGSLKEVTDAPDLESFRDADWVPLRRGTGGRGTQRVGEWFSGLRGSSRRTSVGR